MLIEHEGKRPTVHESAYVAPTAVLCGDVTLGPDCRILFGAVLTAERGRQRGAGGARRLPRDRGVRLPRRPHRPRQRGAGGRRGPREERAARGDHELWAIQQTMDFPGTVFGLERAEATMDRVSARYAESFGQHRRDRVLD